MRSAGADTPRGYGFGRTYGAALVHPQHDRAWRCALRRRNQSDRSRRHAVPHVDRAHRAARPVSRRSGAIVVVRTPPAHAGGVMKIAILSRNSKLYSTARLVEAARTRGHRVRVLDPLRCYMRIAPGDFAVHYKGRALADYDAVIPRVGASITFYGTAVLRQFEMMGVYTPNSSDAILRARDKLRCLQLLAREKIGLPATVFGDNPDDTADLLRMLGDPPHVIKLNEGAQGQGVLLAEKQAVSQSVIEAFRGLYANFLVQEFVREARGADIRCFVVGGKVVAAMRRQ